MESLRIDKWLWFARFVKSRSLAQDLIDDGTVTLNGLAVAKTSTLVKVGDRIEFTLRERPRSVTVLALADHRGPATEAALLYREAEGVWVTRMATDNPGSHG